MSRNPRQDLARKRRLRRRNEAWEVFEQVLAEIDERLNHESYQDDLERWSYGPGMFDY